MESYKDKGGVCAEREREGDRDRMVEGLNEMSKEEKKRRNADSSVQAKPYDSSVVSHIMLQTS